MAQAPTHNMFIENYRGANTDIVFSTTLSVRTSEGNVLPNLAGAQSSFGAKKSYRDNALLISATESNGITIDETEGTIKLDLTVAMLSEIRSDLPEQTFVYDWDLVDNTGSVIRLIKGTLTIGGDV